MTTIDATLRDAVPGAGNNLPLPLDPALQGLPDTAHGGSVLALFDVLAAKSGRRTLRGHYHRRVPLGVPLSLRLAREADGLACRVADGAGAVLVEGGVAAGDTPEAASTAAPGVDAVSLPVSRTCFACGVDNTLGLRVQLTFDAPAVGGASTPRPRFRAADGRRSSAALTTLLDETAFWLGALATGEAGMTTELAGTPPRDPPPRAALVGGEPPA